MTSITNIKRMPIMKMLKLMTMKSQKKKLSNVVKRITTNTLIQRLRKTKSLRSHMIQTRYGV
jgi:hypothetical protein